uniref:ATP synthase CF0 subunit II n=1 Tax=Thalassionema bacillare TaxID=426664 RepID=UPI001EDDAFE5|nr:ATP synthase CF0 subunit II [Thalassionema bacillare]UHY40500.1 ATP synthase CF0 subunit II [Thalassionema bacillare]UHY40887.1 ATP synthase CF0 subunit II [Thalassionema bacillare]UHY41145.1 ATP synthase CF0 subunit II [Thalassionema bacillare]
MINFLTLLFSSDVSGPGGLFDIDATLPLIALEFILLMVILNIILYSPLLTVIEERKEYILTKLSKASELLAEANKMTTQYEEELTRVRSEAQLEITNSQKIHKEILDLEITMSQNYLDDVLDAITNDFEEKRTAALENLEESVQSLCNDINNRLAI